MSIFTFISKAMAIWATDGAMFEEIADVIRKHQAARAAEPPKPSEVANEFRKAAGNPPMTPGEQAAYDREHQIHRRDD